MKPSFFIIGTFAISSLLISCTTPYKPNGFMGGYSDLQLNKNTFKVTFRGNGYTALDTVKKYLLYRCAEVTKNHGYRYFTILDSSLKDDQRTITTPTKISSHNNYSSAIWNGMGGAGTETTITPDSKFHLDAYEQAALIRTLHSNKHYKNAINANLILNEIKIKT